ncbi:MAG: DNA polymerase III subunit [Candidatus Omnitrophica bacterium]|nr:DNA polymerase III subunit [Candidatus Omnitrophota bacterium]
MSFSDIKGQDSAVSFLKASLNSGRLAHAYIFSGPHGVGKFLTALSFAEALNCKNPVIVRPEKEGGSIKIDDIRQLIKDAYLKPFEGTKKVYIIDGAELMKHEAANALLKTLEEPPADSIIILISDSLRALFHTIVSRSQVVRFYPLKLKEIKDILIKEYSLDSVKAHVLSRLSSGRLGEALKFKDGDIYKNRLSLINGVSKGGLGELDFDNIPKDNLALYLDILLAYFRDILNTKAGMEDSGLINIDRKDMISSEAKRLSFNYLENVMNNIFLTYSFLDRNANPKLAMSVLAAKICEA